MAHRDVRRYHQMSFERKQLQHAPPDWVKDGEVFFITICLEDRTSKQLVEPVISKKLLESVEFYQTQGYWWVQLLVFMPDHIHALISFNQKLRGMSECIRSWKSFLKRSEGIEWQRGYFDHRLRTPDSVREKSLYIRNNPVRAGLVEKPEDWPHIWSEEDLR